jgi:hypothetical protein
MITFVKTTGLFASNPAGGARTNPLAGLLASSVAESGASGDSSL